jgi:REP element-mobilizing transposase RayT
MVRNYTQLYLHCVWATWDRKHLITPDIEDIVYAAIVTQCRQLECTAIAIGGIADHVHLLTDFPPTLKISELVGQAKGSSSHLITHEVRPGKFFRWQGGYGAFTVGSREIDIVANYIRNQKNRHHQKSIRPAWEVQPPN